MFLVHRDQKLKLLAATLAGLGAFLMVYLTRLHFSESGSTVCDISAGLSCDLVNKSLYSEIFGIPVAILGLLFFLSIPYLLYVKPFKKPWRIVLLSSIFSLVFGIYLSLLEQFVIHSICIFCETSKLLMIALIAVSAYGVKHEKERLPGAWIAWMFVVALASSGIIYLIQQGS